MEFKIQRQSRNIIVIDAIAKRQSEVAEFLLISDLHLDNPHCRRDLLLRDLEEAKRRNAMILINGDLMCLMQGKADPRHSKGDILPQHMGPNYFDKVIQETVEFLEPYAHHIAFIGYGNHETSVIKRQEFDPLQNVVTLLNYKTKANIALGGYGGWLILRHCYTNQQFPFKMKYIHGYGGGGVVTKGVIQNQREIAGVHGCDAIWMGHVHELYHHVDMVESITTVNSYKVTHRPVHQIRTSTYKDEFADGNGGFHVEKGRKVKPLGGYWLKLSVHRESKPSNNRSLIVELNPTVTFQKQNV